MEEQCLGNSGNPCTFVFALCWPSWKNYPGVHPVDESVLSPRAMSSGQLGGNRLKPMSRFFYLGGFSSRSPPPSIQIQQGLSFLIAHLLILCLHHRSPILPLNILSLPTFAVPLPRFFSSSTVPTGLEGSKGLAFIRSPIKYNQHWSISSVG